MSVHEYARRERQRAMREPIGYAIAGPSRRHDGEPYVQYWTPDRDDAELELERKNAAYPGRGYELLEERSYTVRMYARGARRLKVSVQAYGLRSAVRIAEELNPGFTATVVEA